jgi:hypothetical protein
LISDPKCKITSPDYFIDKITGQRREVDISIKVDIGYLPLTIIVECRDRDSKEDVTWIEQLVLKCANIKVNKVIAVSSNDFTEPAKKSAEHYGIETRVLSEITKDDVKSWFMGNSLEICNNLFCIINASLGLANYEETNFKMESKEKIFSFKDESYSFEEIFREEVINKKPELYEDIEINGPKKIKKIKFKIPNKYSIKAPNSKVYYLESFIVDFELWIEYKKIPFSKLIRYSDESRIFVEGVSSENFKIGEDDYTFSLYRSDETIKGFIKKLD